MKVLVLTPGVFDKGGIARYGRFQVRAIREACGEGNVRVVSLVGRQADDLEEPFAVDWSGPVPLSRFSRAYFAGVAARQAMDHRPAVILTQHLNLGPLALPLARMTGARLAQNVYGREIWSGVTPARRWALRRSDLLVSDCHNSADRIRELDLARTRPVVVWDCVDLDRFAPGPCDPSVLEAYGIPRSRRFRVVFLGRLNASTRYKGTERLLALTARLDADRFETVIAGKGDDLPHLRTKAAELGLRDRVALPGAVSEGDLPALYRSADAFYLVSESGRGMGEGIPLTPLEAMACGVPVLVGNRDGSREILESGGGLCTDPENLEGQASYLERLSADPDLHRAERQAARERAETAFGFAAFSVKTRRAIESIVDRA